MGKPVCVAIVGCGVVGSGLGDMLTRNRDAIAQAAGTDVRLKYMVDVRAIDTPEGVTLTSDFEQVLADDEVRVIAETIGGVGVALDYTRRALKRGVSVITSNKELVACHGDELKRIAREHGAWYLYEASVCGGVPVLRPIGTCLAGNRIEAMSGIVNGSTNYLLTRMEQSGMSFSTALGEAKALGYVEANPAADVEGWDARRKLLILAAAAFGCRLTGDEMIPTEGIARVTERDMACAEALGGAVKLIAHARRVEAGWTGWVRPALVMKNNPLSTVSDVFNALTVTGDCVGDVMFYGRGAGKLPTASALVGDLIEIVRAGASTSPVECSDEAPAFVPPDDCPVALAVRVEGNLPGSAAFIERRVVLGDMTAVRLCRAPFAQAMKDALSLARDGARVGIPLIIF